MQPIRHQLSPLQEWICDECGEVISSVDDGWLEWYQERDENGGYSQDKGFRIVHHLDCMYNEKVLYSQNKSISDMHLKSYTQADGLNALLSKLERGTIADVPAYIEIIRRLHLPYYEEARLYHEEAERDGYFDGENELTRGREETSIQLLNRYNP